MASVKSVTTFRDQTWSGGVNKRRYQVVLTDNNLVDHTIIGMPVKVDPLDDGTETANSYLIEKADREVTDAVRNTYDGVSPETVSPVWNTQQDFDRRVIGRMMLVHDSHAFWSSLSFFQGIESRGGANASQRATYLGITRPVYDLIADRYGDVQGAAFFITDEKGQVWTTLPPEFE